MHFRTKETSETTLFRGDEGLSSTISIYRVTIKHCLIPYVKDCSPKSYSQPEPNTLLAATLEGTNTALVNA